MSAAQCALKSGTAKIRSVLMANKKHLHMLLRLSFSDMAGCGAQRPSGESRSSAEIRRTRCLPHSRAMTRFWHDNTPLEPVRKVSCETDVLVKTTGMYLSRAANQQPASRNLQPQTCKRPRPQKGSASFVGGNTEDDARTKKTHMNNKNPMTDSYHDTWQDTPTRACTDLQELLAPRERERANRNERRRTEEPRTCCLGIIRNRKRVTISTRWLVLRLNLRLVTRL